MKNGIGITVTLYGNIRFLALNVLPLPLGKVSPGKEVSVLFLNCYLWKSDYRMGKSMVVVTWSQASGLILLP